MEIDSGKWSSSGFILLDCPQSMKIESSTASRVGSISDYFLSLSNGWDLTSFLKSLSKVLKALKVGSCFSSNPKEGNGGPCMVSSKYCSASCNCWWIPHDSHWNYSPSWYMSRNGLLNSWLTSMLSRCPLIFVIFSLLQAIYVFWLRGSVFIFYALYDMRS